MKAKNSLILESLTSLCENDIDDHPLLVNYFTGRLAVRKRAKKRYHLTRRYRETLIWKMLGNPFDMDGRAFQKRYRMKYSEFTQFLSAIQGYSLTEMHHYKEKYELLVLATLRYLGRGCTIDDLHEIVGLGPELIRKFIRRFCMNLAINLYDSYVNIYKNGPNLSAAATSVTSYKALPGCIGSTDGIHIYWERCPAKHANTYIGRYKAPTIAYNVTCDHNRKIISTTQGYPGTKNDKTIILYDKFVHRVRTDPRFVGFRYGLMSANGITENSGCYLLCDGGYHKWRVLMCPNRYTSIPEGQFFSEMIESYRKDVECVFGIMRKRFRILKYPLMLKRIQDCDAVFVSCCIIHNFLLQCREREREPEPNNDTPRYEEFAPDMESSDDESASIEGQEPVDPEQWQRAAVLEPEIEDSFFSMREKLQTHLAAVYPRS